MNFETAKVSQTHIVWSSLESSVTDVRKGIVKCRMLTGTNLLQIRNKNSVDQQLVQLVIAMVLGTRTLLICYYNTLLCMHRGNCSFLKSDQPSVITLDPISGNPCSVQN